MHDPFAKPKHRWWKRLHVEKPLDAHEVFFSLAWIRTRSIKCHGNDFLVKSDFVLSLLTRN